MQFERLQQLVAHATESSKSSFYRKLYGLSAPFSILTPEAWQKLPFLTKEALVSCPLRERLFMPIEHIDAIQSTSGTTGKPTFSARSYRRGLRAHLHHYDFSTPLLAVSLTARFETLYESLDRPPQVIALDPRHIAASVAVAKTAKVGSIFMYTFIARQTAAEIVAQRMNEQIRFVLLMGETTSRSLVDFLRASFPNAVVASSYSLTELDGPMAFACKPLTEEPKETHHAAEGFYFELIDPDSGVVLPSVEGTEGELVVSAYPEEPYAFPLIRYRTGDIVRITQAHCHKHGQWGFSVLGRRELDFLRIPRGMLRTDEIARVLTLQGLGDEFELRYREPESAGDQKIVVEISVDAPAGTDLDALAHTIAAQLRVGPTYTYAQGVEHGLYHPLRCVARTPSGDSAKKKKLVKM